MGDQRHTPAPWQVLAIENEGGQAFRIHAQPHPAMRGFTEPVALVGSEANARLVSASPDLLEALKAVNDCVREHYGNATNLHMAMLGLRDQVRAAIAKAEGK